MSVCVSHMAPREQNTHSDPQQNRTINIYTKLDPLEKKKKTTKVWQVGEGVGIQKKGRELK